MPEQVWQPVTPREMELLHMCFSRSARHRGKLPDAVWVVRGESGNLIRSAMQYIEPGKWERWGLQQQPPSEIRESWSTVLSWLRPLIGNRAAVEVYPQDEEILNTAPIRWFWITPDGHTPAVVNLQNTLAVFLNTELGEPFVCRPPPTSPG